MREILFKAKRVDNGEWVEFYSIIQLRDMDGNVVAAAVIPKGTLASGLENLIDVYPKTICQYTGLSDRNGKMIFEGDMLRYNGSARGVRWSIEHATSNDYAVVEFSYGYAGGWVASAGGHSLNIGTRSDKFEITGNIHDTTETNK